MAHQDPETALAHAAAESPATVGGVISTLAAEMGGTEESRRELFALVAGHLSPKEWTLCLNQLAWFCSSGDSEEALAVKAELEHLGLPPEQISYYQEEALRHTLRNDPEATLDWMQRPESDIPRDRQLSAYTNWAANRPEEAAAWAERNAKEDFMAETVQKLSLSLLRSGWQPGSGSHQWLPGFSTQFHAWWQRQPDAAEEWLRTMPSDIRTHLETVSDAPR